MLKVNVDKNRVFFLVDWILFFSCSEKCRAVVLEYQAGEFLILRDIWLIRIVPHLVTYNNFLAAVHLDMSCCYSQFKTQCAFTSLLSPRFLLR